LVITDGREAEFAADPVAPSVGLRGGSILNSGDPSGKPSGD